MPIWFEGGRSKLYERGFVKLFNLDHYQSKLGDLSRNVHITMLSTIHEKLEMKFL